VTEQTPDFFQNTIAGEPAPTAPPEAAEPPLPPVRRKPLLLPYILFTIFILTALPGPLFFAALFLPGPNKEAKTIIIPRGTSVQEIGRILDQNNLLINPLLFRGMARMMAHNQLQAGEYTFEPGQSVVEITAMLRDGKTVLRQITVPEGLTSNDIVTLIRNTPDLTGDVPDIPEEGSLLPESYRYSYGENRAAIIERMEKDQRDTLAQLWETRAKDLPLTSPGEALILASIVEKETGKMAEERARVAGVFYNRLKRKMPLQTDPTVIYALTKGEKALGRSLTRADLSTPSPFNTYLNAGLPPAPICNPGRAALEAALNPESHDLLYFVANGSGGHSFSRTLNEHNKNVSHWQSLHRP